MLLTGIHQKFLDASLRGHDGWDWSIICGLRYLVSLFLHSPSLTSDKALMERSLDYDEYITSAEWREKRAEALARAGNMCQQCGANGSLEVHHLTYKNLGNERPEELLVLCRFCHALAHNNLSRASKMEQWQEISESRRAWLYAKAIYSCHPVLSILAVLWLFGRVRDFFGIIRDFFGIK
jgi:hypothetical protein